MTETPDTRQRTRTTAGEDEAGGVETTIAWLESEFPGWTVETAETATWEGALRPLWIARQAGHHPQSEMTAAKLHSRLSDYLEREARRKALSN